MVQNNDCLFRNIYLLFLQLNTLFQGQMKKVQTAVGDIMAQKLHC